MAKSTAFGFALVASAALFFAVILTQVSGEEFQCGGKNLNLNETQKADLMACLAKFGVKSILKMQSSDFPCFAQCMFKIRKFLNDDGKVDLDVVTGHFDNIIVDKTARDALKIKITECIKSHGDSVKKDDTSCMSFMGIVGCVKDGMFDICVAD